MDELQLLEVPKRIEPCAVAQAIIDAHGNKRHMSLTKFKGEPGHCVWCAESFESKGLKPHHMRRWCSNDCALTASFLCHPQSPNAKMHRLIFQQNFACKMCGESFEDEIRERIAVTYERDNKPEAHCWFEGEGYRQRRPEDPPKKVSLHLLGDNTGDQWQTDHIVPIHKGGKGIDPDNLQVICVPCHKLKTAKERQCL